jgi:hypothetical protein
VGQSRLDFRHELFRPFNFFLATRTEEVIKIDYRLTSFVGTVRHRTMLERRPVAYPAYWDSLGSPATGAIALTGRAVEWQEVLRTQHHPLESTTLATTVVQQEPRGH